jgi:hypothetical protein
MKPYLCPTVYIGNDDIQEWLKGEGKHTLMPELLVGYEKLQGYDDYDSVDEVHVLRVEAIVRGKQKAFDFYSRIEEKDDSLQKIYEWAIEWEEYEMCERIIHLGFNLNEE